MSTQCCSPAHNLWRCFKYEPDDKSLNEVSFKGGRYVPVGKFKFEADGLSCYCENILQQNSLDPNDLLKKANPKYTNRLGYISTSDIIKNKANYHLTVNMNEPNFGLAHCSITINPHEELLWKHEFRALIRDLFQVI